MSKRKVEESDGTEKRTKVEAKQWSTNAEFYRLLLQTKAEDFAIGDKPKKDTPIFVCYRTDKLVDVWKGLLKHNFLSCPVVLKEESKYFGFVDMVDIVKYLIAHFGPSNILGKEKDFWDLVEEEKTFATKTVNDVMTYPLSTRNPFHPVREGYSALAVVEALAKEESLHRVPVVDNNRQMFNLVTQSQVIDFLHKNITRLGDKAFMPVGEIKGVLKPVISVKEESLAIDAFNLMVEKNISGIAVVDENGALKGNLSLRDIKLISYDARLFWRLQQSVKNFIAKLRTEWQSKHGRPRKLKKVKATATLQEVIKTLAENKIHRVYIWDPVTKKAEGVISLKDVLSEIISS
jgi:CBS domain-containing protein